MEVKTMELKKSQQLTTGVSKESPATLKNVQDFVGNVKTEIKKITWTNFDELWFYTKVVVWTTFLFGMGIYIADLTIQLSLSIIEWGIRLITG